MEKMEPNTVELIRKIKKTLDPNGIMNPGNWG
jgi:glycolate oxidase